MAGEQASPATQAGAALISSSKPSQDPLARPHSSQLIPASPSSAFPAPHASTTSLDSSAIPHRSSKLASPSSSRSWIKNAFESLKRPKSSHSRSPPSKDKQPTVTPELLEKPLPMPPPEEERPKTLPERPQSPKPSPVEKRTEPMRDSAMMDSENTGEESRRVTRVESLPTIVVNDEEGEHETDSAKQKQQEKAPTASTSRNASIAEEHPEDSSSSSSNPEGLQEGERHDSSSETAEERKFRPISTAIPTSSFDDLTNDSIQFSTRGSLMLLGKKANFGNLNGVSNAVISAHMEALKSMDDDEPKPAPSHLAPPGRQAQPRNEGHVPRSGANPGRFISADDVLLSKKVRFMYEIGDERAGEWTMEDIQESPRLGSFNDQSSISVDDTTSIRPISQASNHAQRPLTPARSIDGNPSRMSVHIKEPTEVAGGMEDWDDVGGDEVDRYGFIIPKKSGSRDSNQLGSERPTMQRVSTALQLASETPRRQKTLRRTPSLSRSTKSGKKSGRTGSLRPPASLYSYRSTNSFMSSRSRLRYAASRLPHFRDRRQVDLAGDMLTLPPGLADIAEAKEGGRAILELKKKEWQREDKWRLMGKVVSHPNGKGGGMFFEFDPKDPKVISRTWKGIPDRWRATAWWSFMEASARNHQGLSGGEPAEELIAIFYQLQDEASPDDVQIDVDVPRTISCHIMFRRRYRGGQRLLFRVLHALSLYMPDTGYVQGMAALAATFLCYFDEEKAFVMLFRLFKLRGLEKLYQAGFEGLMEALADFERNWLEGSDVAAKLEDLGITSTSYGTRWYLTLFNYSLPFAAQLRVWDVFILLGDISNGVASPAPGAPATEISKSFGADLDVLHATSMALIDATREILMDSDFENAMKVLTSWVPVRDEEMLMKVVRVEWRAKKKRGDKAAVIAEKKAV